jgi:hypothetical protein
MAIIHSRGIDCRDARTDVFGLRCWECRRSIKETPEVIAKKRVICREILVLAKGSYEQPA